MGVERVNATVIENSNCVRERTRCLWVFSYAPFNVLDSVKGISPLDVSPRLLRRVFRYAWM